MEKGELIPTVSDSYFVTIYKIRIIAAYCLSSGRNQREGEGKKRGETVKDFLADLAFVASNSVGLDSKEREVFVFPARKMGRALLAKH